MDILNTVDSVQTTTATAAQFEAFELIRVSENDFSGPIKLALAASGFATKVDLADEVSFEGGPRQLTITGSSDDEHIISGEADDTLGGGEGNDRIDGGRGNDLLTGGIGADIFVAASGGGEDIVTDFLRGTDRIDLTDWAGEDVLSLADLSFTDLGSSTRIDFSDGSTLTLANQADPALLTEDDFIFGVEPTPIGAFDEVGEFVPDLGFVDADGAAVNLLDYGAGARFIVLSVCAEWCTPCFRYSDDLPEIVGGAGADFAFVEVLIQDVNFNVSQTIDAVEWRTRFGLDVPILTTGCDEQAMTNFLRGTGLNAIPLYLVLDAATGEIVDRSVGYEDVATLLDDLDGIANPPPPNSAPIAEDDAFATDQDFALQGNVLDNDHDPDGDFIFALLDALPEHGELLDFTEEGFFFYQPDPGFLGTDSFTYVAVDGNGLGSNLATVTITIEAPDDDPPTDILIDNFATGVRAGSHLVEVGIVNVIDPDPQEEFRNNPVTISGDARVELVDGTLFVATDLIDFAGGERELHFTLTTGLISRDFTLLVFEPNDAPVAVDDFGYSVAAGGFIIIPIAELLANDSDPEGGALTLLAVDNGFNGHAEIFDDVAVFFAEEFPSGSEANFIYFIEDEAGLTAAAQVSLTIGEEPLPG